MMNKEQKKNYISEMTTQFENSKAIMVTHYQGLTMPQLDELRAKMREKGIIFKITKNRITKLALEKTKCKDLSNLFTGPTAVAFGTLIGGLVGYMALMTQVARGKPQAGLPLLNGGSIIGYFITTIIVLGFDALAFNITLF